MDTTDVAQRRRAVALVSNTAASTHCPAATTTAIDARLEKTDGTAYLEQDGEGSDDWGEDERS
ncbi:hypothetical protein E4U49_002634 [Claviceps purpurea]|nr:hypothetical protein E4U49_002634 [Claviceps purpurea]